MKDIQEKVNEVVKKYDLECAKEIRYIDLNDALCSVLNKYEKRFSDKGNIGSGKWLENLECGWLYLKKIIFYKKDGQVKSEEILTKENLKHIHGMMTKCTMENGKEEVGFADSTGVYDIENYDGKIKDYIYLWTWDNLDEATGKLIGNDDEKYNHTLNPVKIDEIENIEAILYSNPRWGGKLTNKFEFFNNTNEKELEIPEFLTKFNNKNNDDEEINYYFLTVRYEEYFNGKEYNYISDDTSVEVGDRVLVDMAGEVVTAEVIETAYYNKFDAPFLVNKTRKIIKKFN